METGTDFELKQHTLISQELMRLSDTPSLSIEQYSVSPGGKRFSSLAHMQIFSCRKLVGEPSNTD
jgi:hypothetical protein